MKKIFATLIVLATVAAYAGVTPTIGSLLPAQTGQDGKVLGTDGSQVLWVDPSATGNFADKQLSNLSGTMALPISILPVSNNTLDIGSSSFKFKDMYLAGSLNLPTKTANTVFAGPTTGSAAAPAFRALVAADIPSLSYANQTLSNLGTTNINGHLLFDTADTYNLGSASKPVNNIYTNQVIGSSLGELHLSSAGGKVRAHGGVQLWNDSIAAAIYLKPPPSGSNQYNLIMPVTDGPGSQFMKNSGGGQLIFTDIDQLQGVGVASTAPTNGQILRYNSTSTQWEPVSAAGDGTTFTVDGTINPGTPNTFDIGTSAASAYRAIRGRQIIANDGTTSGRLVMEGTTGQTTPDSFAVGGTLRTQAAADSMAVYTLNNSTNNSVATGTVYIESGNKTAGTGDSGDIVSRTGTSAGGVRGKIRFKDGTHGVAGYVWVSVDTLGAGAWTDPTTVVAASPQGTLCGWYDVVGTALISSCLGEDPSSTCPSGYTQASTAAAFFCTKD